MKLQYSILLVAMVMGGVNMSKIVFAQTTPEITPQQLQEASEQEKIAQEIEQWRNVELVRTLKGHSSPVDSLAFSADSTNLFSGGSYNEPRVRLWRVENGRQTRDLITQRSAILSLATSPDGKILASSGDDGGINLWTLERGHFNQTFLEHSTNILSLAITPDSERLVSGGLDGIRVWDLQKKRPLYTLVRFDHLTYALGVHPNNYLLASGDSKGQVKFWDLRTARPVSGFLAHDQRVNSLAFTANGTILITGSHDRTVKIWNLATGQQMHTLRGHPDEVRAVTVHPNGRIIASGSHDGIRIWDLQTGELLSQFQGHSDWVQSLAFSPDGSILASGGFDQVIHLWQGKLEEELEEETL